MTEQIRAVAFLAGIGLVIYGVSLISIPAAFIVAGLALATAAFVAEVLVTQGKESKPE